ncbi:MAG: DUF177 domain-containing protein, partial [Clostridium sp.]|nr:DUF177 domain-containing protein [Clostridium sp.]
MLGKRLKQKEVSVSFEGKSINFEGEEIIFVEPIKVEGVFSTSGDIINFDGTMRTTLNLICSRCLENFNYPLEVEVHEKFSKEFNDEDNDIIIIHSDKVN